VVLVLYSIHFMHCICILSVIAVFGCNTKLNQSLKRWTTRACCKCVKRLACHPCRLWVHDHS